MSENIINNITNKKLKRRTFLKWSGAVTAPAIIGGAGVTNKLVQKASADSMNNVNKDMVIPTCSTLNCGGKCLIKAHIKDGQIVRISTDDDPRDENADNEKHPQIRACVRGRGYRRHVYAPDRIKKPLKRVGKRGEGKFEEITWEEAIKEIAKETKRIKQQYGPASRFSLYATGQTGTIGSGDTVIQRLLALDGGFLGRYSNYSSGQHIAATPYTFGESAAGSSCNTLLDSKLIILHGMNPAETIIGHFNMYLRMAKERGAKIYTIDPRKTDTNVSLADDWFPVKPGTDNALIAAMAYVMFTENLHDQEFLNKYCLGHDEEHMPEGVPAGESYYSYVMGKKDGVMKTPQWAAKITGLPANRIIQLAREVAMTKPMAWVQGNGMNRHMNGEQLSRGGSMIAALTGNIGISGGWAGPNAPNGIIVKYQGFPLGDNPLGISLPVFKYTDAIVRGTEMGAKDGVRGLDEGGTLPANIKMIFNMAGNCLVNQHSDINKTIEILEDESLCEFIVTSDIYMTPSAKYSDIILPTCTFFEQNDLVPPWSYGQHIFLSQKVVEPLYGSLTEYEWMTMLARELGIEQEFTEGRTQDEWVQWMIEESKEKDPNFPSYEEMKKNSVYKYEENTVVKFKEQIEDPENHPFNTPSGKIELFSKDLWDMNNLEEIPAIPKHVVVNEGPESDLTAKYPLQIFGWHVKRRCHSTWDTSDWMEEVETQLLWMNPIDAKARSVKDGDLVKIYNDRGEIQISTKVSSRVMPGVVCLPQGGYFTPDENGVDKRGSINVLTGLEASPFHCNPQHTNLAEVEKA
ncbi:DMSO/selenate family reductase complex A subunit [Bacillus sp. B15-48]|uniref:DMSO/selenate family reductase complex A subunit n=1 Tax=Bacillus sp. B15-48 TaxID=1548601 RepID=UPI00193ED107|nr:DMSO/selenate family reductase complex A subunit [Bacillus sp. B15-48]MBM4760839.1 molybdopterin-dependent oxidoreductase [Bacillus sp. B15-48]